MNIGVPKKQKTSLLGGGLPWRYIAAHCDGILNVERLDKAWHSAGDVKQEN